MKQYKIYGIFEGSTLLWLGQSVCYPYDYFSKLKVASTKCGKYIRSHPDTHFSYRLINSYANAGTCQKAYREYFKDLQPLLNYRPCHQ